MKGAGARLMRPRLLAVAALIGLTACSAARLTDVWQDPGHAGGPFRQVAVFAFGADDATNRLTEDEFVHRLPATTRGAAGHGLVPLAEQGDVARVRDRLRAGGFDGVIVVRMAGPDAGSRGARDAGPDSSRTFGDAYLAAREGEQRAGDARRGGPVRLRTSLYGVPADALVWSAASRSAAPDELRETTAGVARNVMERLQEAGLLAEI
jgi:hypothetical protein